MSKSRLFFILFCVLSFFSISGCNKTESEITVKVYRLVKGMPKNAADNLVGTIRFSDSRHGLVIKPNLHDIEPGLHGFHIHENNSCGPKEKDGAVVLGLDAGGHLDPELTQLHKGPYSKEGHQGDLPLLYVDDKGAAKMITIAPRLTLKDIKRRSVVIHSGADNYSDQPLQLGGGGARAYCGVI